MCGAFIWTDELLSIKCSCCPNKYKWCAVCKLLIIRKKNSFRVKWIYPKKQSLFVEKIDFSAENSNLNGEIRFLLVELDFFLSNFEFPWKTLLFHCTTICISHISVTSEVIITEIIILFHEIVFLLDTSFIDLSTFIVGQLKQITKPEFNSL